MKDEIPSSVFSCKKHPINLRCFSHLRDLSLEKANWELQLHQQARRIMHVTSWALNLSNLPSTYFPTSNSST